MFERDAKQRDMERHSTVESGNGPGTVRERTILHQNPATGRDLGVRLLCGTR